MNKNGMEFSFYPKFTILKFQFKEIVVGLER